MKKNPKKGSIIVLSLLVLLVLLMHSMALISMNKQNLGFSRFNNANLYAQQMAQAGLNHILNIFAHNPDVGNEPTPRTIQGTLGEGSYIITFDSSDPYHSVNNLSSASTAAVKNYDGKAVQGGTADILITGHCTYGSAQATRRIHVILRRNFDSDMSLATGGKIVLDGDTRISGIESMLSKDAEVGGGIHSNYDSKGDRVSIRKSRRDKLFRLGLGALLSCAGEQEGLDEFMPKENYSPRVLPSFTVKDMVKKEHTWPLPDGLVQKGHRYECPGTLNVVGENFVGGPLTVYGDVNLCDGTLYVDGNLKVNGGIKGFGGLYVAGDVNIIGGSVNLVTNQKNSAALFADGDIRIEGDPHRIQLNTLDIPSTELGDKYKEFTEKMNALNAFLQSKDLNGSWDFSLILADDKFGRLHKSMRYWFVDGNESEVTVTTDTSSMDQDRLAAACAYWAIYQMGLRKDIDYAKPLDFWADDDTDGDLDGDGPQFATFTYNIADPDGVYAMAHQGAIIPDLIREIEKKYQVKRGDGADNKEIHKMLLGLNEMAYMFRTNHTYDGCVFHDNKLPIESQSFAHQIWYTVNSTGACLQRDSGILQTQEYLGLVKNALLYNNPMSPSWGERSYFQGVLYTNGNIDVSKSVDIFGSVVSQGNVRLDDTNIIYVADFMRLWGSTAPLSIVYYRDF